VTVAAAIPHHPTRRRRSISRLGLAAELRELGSVEKLGV
jgi:hypothetical protein